MTTPAIAPQSHHELGPSQWPAWSLCPCYDGEQDIEDADVEALLPHDQRPKKEDKTAKGRGTLQHEALAKALRGIPNAFEGLTGAEEEQVRWVAESVVESAAAVGYTSDELHVEQRLTMFEGDSFKVLYFGTADVEYGPFIDDAKMGDPRNYFAQVCGYALAKMERDGLDRIHARLRYGRWKKVVTHVIDRETAELVAYSILRRRADPNRQPVLCEFCGWCKHRATCSATTGVVSTVLSKRADWAIRLPTMSVREAGVDPVTIGAMKFIWKAWVAEWGAGVDYAAQAMAAGGIIPLGFKRQDEKGRLEIDDGAGAHRALRAAGISEENLFAAFSYSLTSLTVAYQAQFGGSEKAAKAKLEEILVAAGVARRGEPGFKLIRKPDGEDDIRAAMARPALPAGHDNPTGQQT